MKKLALSLLFVSSLANAKEVVGLGEYRFGPDTPQNVACEMAEDRAKENAIAKFSGESIETVTFAQCQNENCDIQRDSFAGVKGYIKTINRKSERVSQSTGHTSCIVTVYAEVEKATNAIRLKLDHDAYNFKENDEVNFRAMANKPGFLGVYNYYNGIYRVVAYQTVAAQGKEFVVPSTKKTKLVASLPAGELQSKELVTFVFTENWIDLKETYTQAEFKNLVTNIPEHKRDIVNRYVYIVR
jgi:hypothetical protein